MNRPVSPLLHDYKSYNDKPARKARAGRWFSLGLGIPLIAVSLLLAFSGSDERTQASGENSLATNDIESFATQRSKPNIQLVSLDLEEPFSPSSVIPGKPTALTPVGFHPPLALAERVYETVNLTIQRGDTLDNLFRRHKLNIGHLAVISRMPSASKYLSMLRPGDELEIKHDDGNLISLYRELDLTSALMISREDAGFTADLVERPIEIRKRRAYGRIDSSLFESGAAAGLSDKLIMNLAGIYAWDVDFVLDIRIGDDYYVLYEEIYQDGEFVTDGEIIAAEFNNDGRTYQALRFVDDEGRSEYFTPDGNSVRKAFIRAPVDFSRISSSFNPRRRHPVLNTIRAHRGVDYAAPRGTPIKAAGDGKVIFRGRKGGYGNSVILQHGGNITTLYAHMSKFAGTSRVGKRVRQGQTIGYVGATGLVTAAHLHYEYRLNGVHRNPRTVKLPQADPIRSEYKQRFLAQAEAILAELSQYKRTQIAVLSLN